jgi:hypothetical protein
LSRERAGAQRVKKCLYPYYSRYPRKTLTLQAFQSEKMQCTVVSTLILFRMVWLDPIQQLEHQIIFHQRYVWFNKCSPPMDKMI